MSLEKRMTILNDMLKATKLIKTAIQEKDVHLLETTLDQKEHLIQLFDNLRNLTDAERHSAAFEDYMQLIKKIQTIDKDNRKALLKVKGEFADKADEQKKKRGDLRAKSGKVKQYNPYISNASGYRFDEKK